METRQNIALKAAKNILHSLVRILVRYGVSHPEFAELAKQVYVDVVNRHYSIPGKKNTVSRTAVLSGLSRKDVLRLKETRADPESDATLAMNRATRVLGGWLRDAEFHDQDGNPKNLPFKSSNRSFKDLVKKYSGDITARTILDELIRIGAAELVDKNTVRLITQGYIPLKSEEDKIRIMGISTADLLNTIQYNLDPQEYPRFQREVIYTELPKETIAEFKLLSHEKSLELLLELNRWLSEKKAESIQNQKQLHKSRVGLGIYYIENDVDEVGDEKS
jgi:hypothetical protein